MFEVCIFLHTCARKKKSQKRLEFEQHFKDEVHPES